MHPAAATQAQPTTHSSTAEHISHSLSDSVPPSGAYVLLPKHLMTY